MEKREDGWRERGEYECGVRLAFSFPTLSHLGTLFRMDLLLQLLISADDLTSTLKCALLNSQVILNPIRWTMRLIKPSHTKKNQMR